MHSVLKLVALWNSWPWIKVFNKLYMLHYVMFECCTTIVWTHLPLATPERTALLPHFWEKPGWKKMDITELLHHMHMGGHCVCVWTGFASVTCVCVFVRWTVLQDLREVVGSVVRNGPIGQRLQEAQHWHGLRVLGALDLLMLAADDRRTNFNGSLGRQHMRHQMRFTIRRSFPKEHGVPTYTGCLMWLMAWVWGNTFYTSDSVLLFFSLVPYREPFCV